MYVVFRPTGEWQIKAQHAGNGCSLGKGCKAYRFLLSPLTCVLAGDAELAFSCRP
jgi:hypothetical protein